MGREARAVAPPIPRLHWKQRRTKKFPAQARVPLGPRLLSRDAPDQCLRLFMLEGDGAATSGSKLKAERLLPGHLPPLDHDMLGKPVGVRTIRINLGRV